LRPQMIVVAGPIASGKTGAFRRLADELDAESFNVDDRCAELNDGSYRQLPPEVVKQATRECEEFIHEHIADGVSFIVETTLRTPIAIEQAGLAREAGLETWMTYVATENPEINVKRAAARREAGGRDMTDETVRDNYEQSLANLPRAMRELETVEVYDNSAHLAGATLQLRTEHGRIAEVADDLRDWVVDACRGTEFECELELARGRDSGPER
jgi:predicted ABC-type ATPase